VVTWADRRHRDVATTAGMCVAAVEPLPRPKGWVVDALLLLPRSTTEDAIADDALVFCTCCQYLGFTVASPAAATLGFMVTAVAASLDIRGLLDILDPCKVKKNDGFSHQIDSSRTPHRIQVSTMNQYNAGVLVPLGLEARDRRLLAREGLSCKKDHHADGYKDALYVP